MFCVVNANREQTQTAEEVVRFIESMEATSKLKVTGLINNTHFIRQTTVEGDILPIDLYMREEWM